MKLNLWVIIIVIICVGGESKAQQATSFSGVAITAPLNLQVGYNKTTHIIFPLSIVSIDRGSAGILAQKAEGVENILKVKADQKNFEETNLSVITIDGRLYSFLVCYSGNPACLTINLDSALSLPSTRAREQSGTSPYSKALLADYAKQALAAKQNLYGVKKSSAKASIALEGVYVKENTLFLRFWLRNTSTINYHIDGLRLFVRDKWQAKRTAIQEREIEPVFVEGDSTATRANGVQSLVVAVPAFTLPKEKYLAVEATERNGGRNLSLKVKGKHLLKAQALQ